jgi:cell division transport system permease protein
MWSPRFDIPFARDDANRFLPAIIAIMVALVALLLAIGVSLTGAVVQQGSGMNASLQIQVTLPSSASSSVRTETETALKEIVQKTAGIASVTLVTREEVSRLLSPWLGDSSALSGVNLPVLADVTVSAKESGQKAIITALRSNLKASGFDAVVATPQAWLSDLAQLAYIAQATLLLLSLCLVASLVALAVLIARTSLRLHFKVVNLLHLLGAADDYILRQFQYHHGWVIGKGALMGAVGAACIFIAAHSISVQMNSPIMPVIEMSFLHLLVFVGLPVIVALASLVATRATVAAMLHKMP